MRTAFCALAVALVLAAPIAATQQMVPIRLTPYCQAGRLAGIKVEVEQAVTELAFALPPDLCGETAAPPQAPPPPARPLRST